MTRHDVNARGGHEPVIHIYHHSLTRGGGKERFAIALVAAFKQLGREVVYHTMRAEEGLAESLKIPVEVIHPVGVPRKLRDLWFFRKVRPQADDAIHIALSRVRCRDLLISAGTHRGYLSRARKWPGPFDYLQYWFERESYGYTRRIITFSDLLTRDLQHFYGLPVEKLVTLYPPIDERFLKLPHNVDRRELRKKFNWPTDKVVFLFPSSGHSRKGLGPIHAAMANFEPQALLAIAGKHPGGGKSAFVQYLGYVENLQEAYHAADFTVLGSTYEPFGLVGPESVMCGTWLVFEKDIGCLPAIRPEHVITFSIWDRESIRDAIGRAIALAGRNEHRAPLGTAGLTYDPDPLLYAEAVLTLARAPQHDVARKRPSG